MDKKNLNPADEILDIMMEDATFVKGRFANLSKETIRNVLTGKDTEILKKIMVVERTSVSDADIKSSEIYRGSIQLKVTSDQLIGKICLFPDGELETIQSSDIEEALYFFGVQVGINHTLIHRLVQTPIFRKDFVIARGTAPVHGKPGEIKYYFNTNTKFSPEEDSRGNVNYKELGKVRTVKEGDLLCEWVEGNEGIEGVDIFGSAIPAKVVKSDFMRAGKNTRFSMDRMQIYACCDGEVSCINSVVSVDKILRLRNVDISTGNIRFIGSIHISGKVCEGYVVKATQNIIVNDVIENAQVSAGNDLTVVRGIIGSEEITVEGNLSTSFIESSNIFVKKDLTADVILTSQVVCEGKVSLTGRKGSMIGGYCNTRELMVVRLGNEAHARTEVEIMTLEDMEREKETETQKLKELEQEIVQKQKLLEMLKRSDSNTKKAMDTQSQLFKLVYEKNACKSNADKLTEKLEYLNQAYRPQVKISGKLYPNTRVKIFGRLFINSEDVQNCTLKYDGDNIIAEV